VRCKFGERSKMSDGVVMQPGNCCFEFFNVINLWHAKGQQASQEEMCVMELVASLVGLLQVHIKTIDEKETLYPTI